MNLNFFAVDDKGNRLFFESSATEQGMILTLKKEDFVEAKSLRITATELWRPVGSEGYYLLPRHIRMMGDPVVEFISRPDMVYAYSRPLMSLFGIKTAEGASLIRVVRNYKYRMEIAVKSGVYSLSLLFDFSEANAVSDPVYDDITLEIVDLPANASLGEFAKAERELRLARGEISLLAEKCRRAPVEYARKYPLIRIRMGWKESPCKIWHQNEQNEPDMYVACTFKTVRDIAHELKKQGVAGAELQLVGWNIGGHDGRFPQLFPADARLGGDEELKKTVEYVKQLGYRISLHTNLIDAYEIADTYDWNDIVVNRKGDYHHVGNYSGGMPYHTCLLKQVKNEARDYPAVAALGVNGLHFTDVISIVEPDACFNPDHPCTTAQGIRTVEQLCKTMQERFGGFSSEGTLDFALKYLDYALYVTFGDGFGDQDLPFCEKTVPFWELIYHGILLYNPTAPTVNFTVQPKRDQQTFFLRGGRPSFYFYSKFRTGTGKNWMGKNDLTAGSPEEITASVAAIAEGLKQYEPFADRQLVFMKDYEVLDNGLEVATYEDGVKIVGNFADEERWYEDCPVQPGEVRLK